MLRRRVVTMGLLALPLLALAGTTKTSAPAPKVPSADTIHALAVATLDKIHDGTPENGVRSWLIDDEILWLTPHVSGFQAVLDWPDAASTPDRFTWSDLVVGEATKCAPYDEHHQACTWPMQARVGVKVWESSNSGKVRQAIVPFSVDCSWESEYLLNSSGAPELVRWDGVGCSEVPGTHVAPAGGDDRAVGKKQIDMGRAGDFVIEGGEVKRGGEALFRGYVDTREASTGFWRSTFYGPDNHRFLTIHMMTGQSGFVTDVDFPVVDVKYHAIYPFDTTVASLLASLVDGGAVHDGAFDPAGFAAYANKHGIEASSWAHVASMWLTRVYNPTDRTLYVYTGAPAKSDLEGRGTTYMVWQGQATSVTLRDGEVLCTVDSHALTGCVKLAHGASAVAIATTGLGFK
jgi:hypothetical protein